MYIFKKIKLLFILPFVVVLSNALADDFQKEREFVRQFISDAKSILTNKSHSMDQKINELELLADKNVDLKSATKFVIGSHWKTMTPDKRREFYNVYKEYLKRSYSGNVSQIDIEKLSDKITFAPKGRSVLANLKYFDDNDIPIEFGLLLSKDRQTQEIKIKDVFFLGLSFLQLQRDEFNDIINTNGIDGLIKFLSNKNSQSK
jgi:phospholipid transport system substrate-binding protein